MNNSQLIKLSFGFTLVELLMVTAIVGILTMMGSVSYSQYIMRAHREDAKGSLIELAAAMERFKIENGTYVGTHDGGVPLSNFYPSTLPVGSNEPDYTIQIESDKNTYTLTLNPIAGRIMNDDGSLTLNSDGTKTWNGSSGWN